MVMLPDGTMQPLAGGGGAGGDGDGANVKVVPAGPAKLEGADRRKLVKEIREEIKPLCSQIADFQIEKANQILK